ncbi:unnamed protein product [Brassica rapa subsp. narinosa]
MLSLRRTGLDTKLPVSHMERGSKSMRDDLYSLSASVLDEMIYVVALFSKKKKKKSLHVFDTETQTWDPVTIGLKDGFYNESIDGKFLVVASNKEVVIYDPKKVRWDVVRIRSRMDCNRDLSAYSEIDNVLYAAWGGGGGGGRGYIGRWRELEGLVGLPELTSESCVRLADHGGKMAVLVSQNLSFYSRFSHKKVIWCGEISLERRNGGCEIWGKVEWFDHVLTVPAGCHVVKVLGVTV